MWDNLNQWIANPMVRKLVTALFVLMLILLLVRYLKRTVSQKINDTENRYRVRKLISFFGYLIFALTLGSIFSDKLERLSVIFGVAGAGVAFALQEVIVSIAGWFAITFSSFFRPGDRVQLGGIVGDVIDVGLLRTTVMECGAWVDGDLYNGRIVRIANSNVFKEPVFNYTGDFEFLWDEIVLPLRQGTDVKLVEKILLDIANELVGDYSREAKVAWRRVVTKYLVEDAKVEPMVSLSLAIDRVNFTLRYVVDLKKRRVTKHEFSKRILERFDAQKPKISFAPSVVEISKFPKGNLET